MVEASRYGQAPAAGDDAVALTHVSYAYDSMGRRIWKQVTQQGEAPRLTVFTWDGDLLQSEERYQGHLLGMAHAPLLELDVEDPSRSYSVPIAQRQHTLGYLANLVPLRRVSYLFEANSFIPAAKLETRFEAIEQQTGTGQSGDTRYQPLAAELYYFQTNHLGTPLEVADSDGNLVWVGQYRAWGQLERAKDGNGERASTDNPLRFQGQYHDEETGLHYNRFRYYDPAVGRFTTQDPIGLMGGENLYQYAPNPTGWVDPLGLETQAITAQSVADAAKADGKRAGAASVLKVGDRTYTGISGQEVSHQNDVTGALMGTPLDRQADWHGGCAEVVCLDKAINDGIDPRGGSISTVNIGRSGSGHGTRKEACSSCQDILKHFGVKEN
ncbi:RHS repeat-associated core domain-containing protein [Cobetia amphilecti]|uniref:RHS repeat-associated core domain-containing protein n=1 Tax=Cobetia amphilecti TaxID=1055104 RepID=UPI001C09CC6E|nr:RHS repeat-associated core domain-containing protein [Cobetia amphilecti]MBU3008788.1 RHS domain-containing protein [Cobetia amphilecti]